MTDTNTTRTPSTRAPLLRAAACLGFSWALLTSPMLPQAEPPSDAPPRPEGIKPLGMFDNRFPAAYEESVPAAMGVLTRFFAGLAGRDLDAIADTLHFPFALYEGIEPIVVESAEDLMAHPPPTLNVTGEGDTTILAGSYDMLDTLELMTFNPVNVGLVLTFSRYTARGAKLEVCEGIYAVTKNDGRWALQLASTIYTPANQLGARDYQTLEETMLRSSRDWMLGWSNSDADLLAARVRPTGLSASVSGGTGAGMQYNPQQSPTQGGPYSSNFLASAQENRPMAIYGSIGVESRLSVNRRDGNATGSRVSQEHFKAFNQAASGGVGDYGYTLILPDQRILHATTNKAHIYGGYIRYTPEGEMISETRSLGIYTYQDQQWASRGGLGQTLYRDRTNDEN